MSKKCYRLMLPKSNPPICHACGRELAWQDGTGYFCANAAHHPHRQRIGEPYPHSPEMEKLIRHDFGGR